AKVRSMTSRSSVRPRPPRTERERGGRWNSDSARISVWATIASGVRRSAFVRIGITESEGTLGKRVRAASRILRRISESGSVASTSSRTRSAWRISSSVAWNASAIQNGTPSTKPIVSVRRIRLRVPVRLRVAVDNVENIRSSTRRRSSASAFTMDALAAFAEERDLVMQERELDLELPLAAGGALREQFQKDPQAIVALHMQLPFEQVVHRRPELAVEDDDVDGVRGEAVPNLVQLAAAHKC